MSQNGFGGGPPWANQQQAQQGGQYGAQYGGNTPWAAPSWQPNVPLSVFRYPYELPVLGATLAVTLIALFIFGALGIGFLLTFLFYLGLSVALAIAETHQYRGTALEVTERQLPHIHQMAVELAQNLSIPKPRLFIVQSPEVNAYTTGFTKPFNVVVYSGLLDLMDERELRGVLAHEFGHAKANHMLFGLITGLGAGNMLNQTLMMPLKWLFFWYQRCCEYTADRAGLVATMDVQAMVTTFIKLATGKQAFQMMDVPAFIEQMESFQGSKMARISEVLSDANHPFALNRIQQIIRFYKSQPYQQLAAQHGRAGTSTLTSGPQGTRELYLRVAERVQNEKANAQVAAAIQSQPDGTAPQQPIAHCGSCGTPLLPGAKFCSRCGQAVAAAAPTEAPRAKAVVRMEPSQSQSQAQPQQRTCPTCQNPLSPTASFCAKCGTRL